MQTILMFNVMGITYFDFATQTLIYGWGIVIVATLSFYIAQAIFRVAKWEPLIWLFCAILGCSSGLVVARTNLLLFPITFITLFLNSIWSQQVNKSRVLKLGVVIMILWGIVGEVYFGSIVAESFHPFSATVITWNSQFIYGEWATKVTIPAVRREAVIRQLTSVGISSAMDAQMVLPTLIYQALLDGKRSPSGEAELFVPRLEALLQP